MTATSIQIDAPRSAVFETIIDPETYPEWLLGARAIRDVDETWPQEGSAFRHVIGFPPLLIPGSSTARRFVRDQLFELGAGMGPLGEANVVFTLEDSATGGTRVQVEERFVAGPAGWTWRFARPIVAALVWGRNAISLESLQRQFARPDTGDHPSDPAVHLPSEPKEKQ